MTARQRIDAPTLITVAVAFPCLWLGVGVVGGVWIRLDLLSFAFATVILSAGLIAPFVLVQHRLPRWLRFGLMSLGASWIIGAFITEYFQVDPSTSTSTGTGL